MQAFTASTPPTASRQRSVAVLSLRTIIIVAASRKVMLAPASNRRKTPVPSRLWSSSSRISAIQIDFAALRSTHQGD